MTDWPATVTVPVRAAPELLTETEKLTELRPNPEAALVIVIQGTDGVALHGQLEPVTMEMLPLSPVDVAETLVGETV